MGLLAIGTFNIESGSVMVSDPCYEVGTWCQGKVDNVKNGTWNAYIRRSDVEGWGTRNTELIILHSEIDMSKLYDYSWQEESFDIGVDSGQAGIYDLKVYRNNDVVGDIVDRLGFKNSDGTYDEGEKFYAKNCDMTDNDHRAGVLNGGVVSSSGLGDGSYNLFTLPFGDEVLGMKVVFIA